MSCLVRYSCFPLAPWSRAARPICKWTGMAEFQSECECQGLSPCHQGVILFSFCPHLFKNKVVCNSLVVSWIWSLPSPSPRGQRLWKNPKILLFVLAYTVIVCACVGGVGCRFHTAYVSKVWGQLTVVSFSYHGCPQIWTQVVRHGNKPMTHWAILPPLFLKCVMCAQVCVYAGSMCMSVCMVPACLWNPEDSPGVVLSSDILGAELKSSCLGGVPLPAESSAALRELLSCWLLAKSLARHSPVGKICCK